MATSEVIEEASAEARVGTAVVPIWGQVAGTILLLAFVAVGFEAFAGPGLRYRVNAWLPGGSGAPPAVPAHAVYQLGRSVEPGMSSIGSEGQERQLLEGDTVLHGDTGRLVRLEAGGRLIDVAQTEGVTTLVSNLGAWDPAAERLTGVTARHQGGTWVLDPLALKNVGADLHPAGAPPEELTDGFTIGPDPDAGRVRRVDDRGSPAIRIRASRKVAALTVQSRQPLTTIDTTLVTVRAVIRGQSGKALTLSISDVVDAAGRTETVVDRRAATEEWTILTVRRQVTFPAPNDIYAVGLLDADGGDWFEVRSLDVFLGVVP